MSTTAEISTDHYASWKKLGRELLARTLEPTRQVSFVIYFLVAVFFFGGLGVWFELWDLAFSKYAEEDPCITLDALRTAIITFFPALAGASGMQMIWAEDRERPLRAFGVLAMAVLVILVCVILPKVVPDSIALTAGAIASLFSLWVWWIANARQADFMDEAPNIDAPTGSKDTNKPLQGDLNGFKTV